MRGRDGIDGSESGGIEEEPSTFGSVLRADYTFARFVVGESNQRAYELARRVAAASDRSRAALYLHGGVGVGKTHLAMAVAHAERARHGDDTVLVVSAARLAAAWAEGGESAAAADEALRGAGLLVVDDVQFLVGTDRVRGGLQRAVDRLRAFGRRLVLTCDLPPSETPELSFAAGDDGAAPFHVAEIAPPDARLRREILLAKAAFIGSTLASDVAAFIAEVAPASVRALEGALYRVLAFATTLRVPVSLAVAERALEAWRRTAPPPTLDAVLDAVSREFGVPRRQIRQAARRDRATVLARQVAIYVARRQTGMPLRDVASELGCRDHSVAAHAFASLKKRLDADPELARQVAALERDLGGRHASRAVGA
ncbi:MAG: DnaA/Hda family protein [Candidatus Binatia bacterium]